MEEAFSFLTEEGGYVSIFVISELLCEDVCAVSRLFSLLPTSSTV